MGGNLKLSHRTVNITRILSVTDLFVIRTRTCRYIAKWLFNSVAIALEFSLGNVLLEDLHLPIKDLSVFQDSFLFVHGITYHISIYAF